MCNYNKIPTNDGVMLLFVFAGVQARERVLWFGRDVFGRRSLLWHLPHGAEDCFTLTSIQLDTVSGTAHTHNFPF